MQVIPAIDLLGGLAVRLLRGRYEDKTVYSGDPAAIARDWRQHVQRLHVVDLDGAREGRAVQRDLVRRIVAEFGVGVQVGGGVRSLEALESYLELGVDRVVLGTAALRQPDLVLDAARRHPKRVIVAVDARDGFVATEGWLEQSETSAAELIHLFDGVELGGVLYTDIDRDGTQVGPNIEATRNLAESCRVAVLASGGVGTLAHITSLAQAGDVIEGVIVGRALHEKSFTLAEAVRASQS